MAKNQGIKKQLREAAAGGITRQEFQKIAGENNAAAVIKRMDAMNKAGRDIRLNSGAANMLIKEAQKAQPSPYGQPNFGSGNIGRALQGMIGTPGYTAPRNPQSGAPYGGSREAIPGTGLMIGGTQIRKGGRVAVRRGDNGMPASQPTEMATEMATETPTAMTQDTMPELPQQVDPLAAAQSGAGADLASFATGWRSAKGSRSRAGKMARGLASMLIAPTYASGVGLNYP